MGCGKAILMGVRSEVLVVAISRCTLIRVDA